MIDIEVKARTILAPDQPWEIAYPAIAVLIRDEVLSGLGEDEILTTSQLADKVIRYMDDPKGAKNRLFQALKALASRDLADCATRKPPRMTRIMGRMVESRPWVWHAPRADYVWPAKTEEAPGPAPISPTFACVDIEIFRALEERVHILEIATLKLARG